MINRFYHHYQHYHYYCGYFDFSWCSITDINHETTSLREETQLEFRKMKWEYFRIIYFKILWSRFRQQWCTYTILIKQNIDIKKIAHGLINKTSHWQCKWGSRADWHCCLPTRRCPNSAAHATLMVPILNQVMWLPRVHA